MSKRKWNKLKTDLEIFKEKEHRHKKNVSKRMTEKEIKNFQSSKDNMTKIIIQSFKKYPIEVYNWFYSNIIPSYKDNVLVVNLEDLYAINLDNDEFLELKKTFPKIYQWLNNNVDSDSNYIRFERL